ncbi:protein RETICULATA, chloroplastic [Sesamum angolense]|uniref:Protein RETICULATA, chloroplastic n=1 Tax=Sesamum angolense TaxID=2727404 RepID=A0AAE1WMU7_9LAMI|nr:protein RETICULATA, chloroplastic [Sesamum angolense]
MRTAVLFSFAQRDSLICYFLLLLIWRYGISMDYFNTIGLPVFGLWHSTLVVLGRSQLQIGLGQGWSVLLWNEALFRCLVASCARFSRGSRSRVRWVGSILVAHYLPVGIQRLAYWISWMSHCLLIALGPLEWVCLFEPEWLSKLGISLVSLTCNFCVVIVPRYKCEAPSVCRFSRYPFFASVPHIDNSLSTRDQLHSCSDNYLHGMNKDIACALGLQEQSLGNNSSRVSNCDFDFFPQVSKILAGFSGLAKRCQQLLMYMCPLVYDIFTLDILRGSGREVHMAPDGADTLSHFHCHNLLPYLFSGIPGGISGVEEDRNKRSNPILASVVHNIADISCLCPGQVLAKFPCFSGIMESRADTGVFEAERPGSRFSINQRIATYFYKGILYGFVGFGCGIIGQGIANLIMTAKRSIKKSEDDIPVPPLIKSAALWGVFLAVSSNTRYQIINGLERLVEASPLAKKVPPVAMAFTVGVRFANNVYGGMQFVDWARLTGVQ